jgi:hypothetical protein
MIDDKTIIKIIKKIIVFLYKSNMIHSKWTPELMKHIVMNNVLGEKEIILFVDDDNCVESLLFYNQYTLNAFATKDLFNFIASSKKEIQVKKVGTDSSYHVCHRCQGEAYITFDNTSFLCEMCMNNSLSRNIYAYCKYYGPKKGEIFVFDEDDEDILSCTSEIFIDKKEVIQFQSQGYLWQPVIDKCYFCKKEIQLKQNVNNLSIFLEPQKTSKIFKDFVCPKCCQSEININEYNEYLIYKTVSMTTIYNRILVQLFSCHFHLLSNCDYCDCADVVQYIMIFIMKSYNNDYENAFIEWHNGTRSVIVTPDVIDIIHSDLESESESDYDFNNDVECNNK